MKRGLPWSLLVHVLGLLSVFLWGNDVTRAVVQPPRTINVRIERPENVPTVPAETETIAPEVAPKVIEVEPDLPPKEKPEVVPKEEPEKPPEDPQPERERPREQEPEMETAEAVATPSLTVSGPSVGSTDSNFPFAWYLSQVEGRIAANWRPRQLGFRNSIACSVHFVIGRSGVVSQVTLSEGSGVGLYDREALRAIQTTRLPPLPPQYSGANLGVTFIFNLEPGR